MSSKFSMVAVLVFVFAAATAIATNRDYQPSQQSSYFVLLPNGNADPNQPISEAEATDNCEPTAGECAALFDLDPSDQPINSTKRDVRDGEYNPAADSFFSLK